MEGILDKSFKIERRVGIEVPEENFERHVRLLGQHMVSDLRWVRI